MYDSKFLYVGCGAHQIKGFIHADISVYKLSKITEIEKKGEDVTVREVTILEYLKRK